MQWDIAGKQEQWPDSQEHQSFGIAENILMRLDLRRKKH